MIRHRLYYFTHSFPFGFGETWKSNELAVLSKRFQDVVVVPYCYGGNADHPQPLPPNVRLKGPLFPHADSSTGRRRLYDLFGSDFGYFIRELIAARAFWDRERFEKWLMASSGIKRLRRHPIVVELMNESDEKTIWYFYWGRGSCDIVPFLKNISHQKTFVRMHGYDLFEYRNDGYIPYRRPLTDSADIIAPSSEAGVRHLKEHYPRANADISVHRCGTVGCGRSSPSRDNVLRIVSCSSLVPLKRVDLLIKALSLTRTPVAWTHLGGGPLLQQCQSLCSALPANVKHQLVGHVRPTDVLQYYISHPIDLFVNVSSTEGLPFSVMEAFSAGIPVFATAVGGTGEIVDSSVGRILPADIAAEALCAAFDEFYRLNDAAKDRLRNAAYQRYLTRCDATSLTEKLSDLLVEETTARTDR